MSNIITFYFFVIFESEDIVFIFRNVNIVNFKYF